MIHKSWSFPLKHTEVRGNALDAMRMIQYDSQRNVH